MKKFFKIFGITLLSLMLTIIVLAGVTIGVLCYVVFTPEKLTPVLKEVAAPYINGSFDVDKVNLTFLSTFPDAGLEVEGLTIISPMEGAQNDTLVHIPSLKAGVDVKAAIDGDIHVHVFRLDNMKANVFIAEDGSANYDILNLPNDSTEDDESDSTSVWTLRSIEFDDALKATADYITFVDKKDSIDAEIYHLTLRTLIEDPSKKDDEIDFANLHLQADAENVSVNYCDVQYLQNARFSISLPLEDAEHAFLVRDAKITLNQFEIGVDGRVGYKCLSELDYDLDLNATTNTWNLKELLSIVPPSIFTMPDSIDADADAVLKAHVFGRFLSADSVDTILPQVDADLDITHAWGIYEPLPFRAENVAAKLCVVADLNNINLVKATIQNLDADIHPLKVSKPAKNHLNVKGVVTDLFDDIHLVGDAKANLRITDFEYFMPESIRVKGDAKANLKLNVRLSEVENIALKKGTISGDFAISELDAVMLDSLKNPEISASSEDIAVNFSLPQGFCLDYIIASAVLNFSNLDVKMDQIEAKLGKTNMDARGEYNMQDSTAIPTLATNFEIAELVAKMDTVSADIFSPKGKITLTGTGRDKSNPRFSAVLEVDSLSTKMGQLISATSSHLGVKASAKHKKGKNNFLLTWSPRIDFDIQKVLAKTTMVPYDIIVPEIKFNYNNRNFAIDTSRIELGNSDFALVGEISNIGPFLDKKGLLKGELRFTSSHADVDQLLDLVNGYGNDESELNAEDTSEEDSSRPTPDKEADPFIVPKGVDMSIITKIDTAYAFGQTLRHVGGQVYCKDGVMTVEEMGFLCEAAKLNLTGIYRTPRRNHLFAGLDFHMTDIRVAELIDMVPQVDSVLPMLRSFKGQAEVHLAAETYMNAYYQLKPSTTRGAVSIAAKDLTLLDGETFTKIAKILTFKKATENKIDSISAEISLYKKLVTIYPFLIHVDRWKVAAGGNHNLAGNFDYHISVLKPLRIGVDVKSKEKKNGDTGLAISPAKCRYAEDFIPVKQKVVETNAMSVRKLIATALRKNDKNADMAESER